MKLNTIIIVAGEPYSTFLEIFFKTYNSKLIKKYNKKIILIVSKNLLIKQMKKLNYYFEINEIDPKKIKKSYRNKMINIINVNFNFIKTFDKISNKSSNYIEKCFTVALNLLKENKRFALINGPISKKYFLKKKYLGITEYLASKTKRSKKEVMLIYNKNLAVSPITTHIPIKKVNKKINKKKIISNVLTINEFYKKQFNKIPKFLVTGLNPHCESNLSPIEENTIIKPAVKFLKNKKIKINGPFPADTIFMNEKIKKNDIVIGMYHDQVLTPIKTLYEFNAINLTLGLPFIRVSPDHGPNSQMLGKNLSNANSLKEALIFLKKISVY